MTDLPLHCICGYQPHINRLEAQLEATQRTLQDTLKKLEQAQHQAGITNGDR
jgi:uncharacterized protein involved in exopolysaccharide biosynthesis